MPKENKDINLNGNNNAAYIILIIIFYLNKKRMCQVYKNCMQSKTFYFYFYRESCKVHK